MKDTTMDCEVIILAAGLGKRMHSNLPKVLHQVAGKPMLFHVIKAASQIGAVKIHVVTGHGSSKVQDYCQSLDDDIKKRLSFSLQKEQLGTANAVACAIDNTSSDSWCLILCADTPLIDASLLKPLLDPDGACLAMLTAKLDDPTGYGRIIRDDNGNVTGIVEEKDASLEQKKITEINTGIMAASSATLKEYLPKIGSSNAQGEYYLTDLAGLLVKDDKKVTAIAAQDTRPALGVNNKLQLSHAEAVYRELAAIRLMTEGLTLIDPERFDLRGELVFGRDCVIDVNVILEGSVVLGSNVKIGAGCIIKDCTIEDDSVILPYTVMEGVLIKRHVSVGPFARLREGSVLDNEVHVGNFVEIKKSTLGCGTKAGHLSYLGDSKIGHDVNIGAGTITCNYDGAFKHQTVIGDDVFVGSDTQLIAPVEVGRGATIGAGTTVTSNVPENSLIITRVHPKFIENYERPKKENS